MPDNPGVKRATQQPVRIDLTSQDLRTGTIRLPRQLNDHFEPGHIRAHDQNDNASYELTFLPPRELAGLADFLARHELRTNDAVIMHVDGQQLGLEPYRRNHRRQPAEHRDQAAPLAASADEAETAATPDAADEAEAAAGQAGPIHFDNGRSDAADEAATAIRASGIQDEPAARDSFHMQPELFTEHAYPEATESPPAITGSAARPDALGAEAHGPDAPDAFDSFASFDGFDTFDDLDDLAPAGPGESMSQSDKPNAAQPLDDAAAIAAATAPTGDQWPHSAHHDVQRRPFAPRQRGANAGTASAKSPPVAEEASNSGSSTAHDSRSQRQPRSSAPQDPTGDAAAVRINRHLDRPDLPSIINGADLADQLGLPHQEVLAELARLSSLPDSRLSGVKPGFYLLKRRQQD